MAAIVQVRRTIEEREITLGIISNDNNQINQTDITPLVNNLEILGIFKDKVEEEGDSVIDAISIIL